MQKNLRDFKGKDAIFIDANLFLNHAFDINPISIEFLKKIESFNYKVCTSALVRGGPHWLDSLTADLRWEPPTIMLPVLQDNLP